MKVLFAVMVLAMLIAGLASAEPRTSEHVFLEKNGGGVEVIVVDPSDTNAREEVQQDLRRAAAERNSLASPAMQEHNGSITYRFEKTKRGARVRITTRNDDALRAIQEYLRGRMGEQESSLVAFSFIRDTALVALPVMVNGSGPYRFLLDTGATHSILSATTADAMKLKIGRRQTLLSAGGNVPVTMRTIDTLQIGEAVLADVEIAVANFALLTDLQVDGILGADYLRRFKIAIDYDKQVVQIESAVDSISMAFG
jgi:hypothetical protein